VARYINGGSRGTKATKHLAATAFSLLCSRVHLEVTKVEKPSCGRDPADLTALSDSQLVGRKNPKPRSWPFRPRTLASFPCFALKIPEYVTGCRQTWRRVQARRVDCTRPQRGGSQLRWDCELPALSDTDQEKKRPVLPSRAAKVGLVPRYR